MQDWWNFPFSQIDANFYICGFDIAFHLWFAQILFDEIWLVWIWWNDTNEINPGCCRYTMKQITHT
jgi:hypothetical protein